MESLEGSRDLEGGVDDAQGVNWHHGAEDKLRDQRRHDDAAQCCGGCHEH